MAKDELLVELETDKVTLEVPAPAAGVLSEIAAKKATPSRAGAVLGQIKDGAARGRRQPNRPRPPPQACRAADSRRRSALLAPAASRMPMPPSVRKLAAETASIRPRSPAPARTGRSPRATCWRRSNALRLPPTPVAATAAPVQMRAPSPRRRRSREERVRMTRLRQTIARRLKEAQNTAAMLTTFNEVDMSAVMALRSQYKDVFEKKHGVKLGFMGFFVRACIQALKEVPEVNAEIDGTDLIYKNHYDIGVAVGTERGLVVPVVRDADQLSLAGIEKAIAALGKKARDGTLTIDDLQGGTFTISNGGVYGSLMSTPILNAPQSGILGMHKIQDRPMAVDGKVEIRPMMYLALSYDHRVVDGQGAVTFLVRVKEDIEDPARLVLDL